MVEDGQRRRWVLSEPFCRFWGIDLEALSDVALGMGMGRMPVLVEMVPQVTLCLPAYSLEDFVDLARTKAVRDLVPTGRRLAFRELQKELELLPAITSARNPPQEREGALH
jgi:hypothetical protein